MKMKEIGAPFGSANDLGIDITDNSSLIEFLGKGSNLHFNQNKY